MMNSEFNINTTSACVGAVAVAPKHESAVAVGQAIDRLNLLHERAQRILIAVTTPPGQREPDNARVLQELEETHQTIQDILSYGSGRIQEAADKTDAFLSELESILF